MGVTNMKKTEGDTDITVVSAPYMAAEAAALDMDTIDLIDLALVLLDKIHLIILCFLAGAVLFNMYAYFCIKPTYQSQAKLYVVSTSKDSVVDLTDLNIGTSLTADYEKLMLSYPVMDRVIDQLKLKMDADELARMYTLTNPADTRILEITATSTDPEMAMKLANTLATVSVKYLPETMSTNAPNIAQKAKIADHKSGPSYTRYTLMGALIGAVLYCAWAVLMYMLDDTIHSAEDMEKYFGVVPLTTVPDNDMIRDDGEEKKVKTHLFKFKTGRRKK